MEAPFYNSGKAIFQWLPKMRRITCGKVEEMANGTGDRSRTPCPVTRPSPEIEFPVPAKNKGPVRRGSKRPICRKS